MLELRPYVVPSWCRDALLHPPAFGRFSFANVPTPLYRIFPSPKSNRSDVSLNTLHFLFQERLHNSTLWIKRDDATHGCELGGNKIRKLEFLLADAWMGPHCDSVITIGGRQSNHCRATACVARMLGLEPHLILRQSPAGRGVDPRSTEADVTFVDDSDVGHVGNLLFDRFVGAQIYTCTPGEYGRIGSEALLSRLCTHLQQHHNKRPYVIPVGGSNGVGTWGYIEAVDELIQQWSTLDGKALPMIDHIVVPCGSGGTAAGIAIGVALAKRQVSNQDIFHPNTTVHAIGVCDDEDYFYSHIAKIATEMGLVLPDEDNDDGTAATVLEFIRRHLVIHQGKGRGYAQSTSEELDFIAQFAMDTGIVLDPVYTGKALFSFVREMEANPQQYTNQNILFWHTGGSLGMFDKSNDLTDSLRKNSPCQRLDVYGKGNGLEI
jgi:D-cysteine desulfhydrase